MSKLDKEYFIKHFERILETHRELHEGAKIIIEAIEKNIIKGEPNYSYRNEQAAQIDFYGDLLDVLKE